MGAAGTLSTAATGRTGSRVARAHSQARRAKVALALGGVAVFLAGIPFARMQHAGHPKRRSQALDAPQRFRRSVRNDLLSAGMLAPAEAPPDAVTALS